MNQFKKPYQDLYDNKFVVPQLHKAITSPLPVIPKQPLYSSDWDKSWKPKQSKFPSLTTLLSNHHYVVASVVFTSIIVLITMFKVVLLIMAK